MKEYIETLLPGSAPISPVFSILGRISIFIYHITYHAKEDVSCFKTLGLGDFYKLYPLGGLTTLLPSSAQVDGQKDRETDGQTGVGQTEKWLDGRQTNKWRNDLIKKRTNKQRDTQQKQTGAKLCQAQEKLGLAKLALTSKKL